MLTRRPGLLLLALLAVSFALYANSINAPFHFDDNPNISTNPYVHSLRFVGKYFSDRHAYSTVAETNEWRPLTMLANGVCWWVADGATWPFHVYKIILHAITAWFVFIIGARLIRKSPEVAGNPEARCFGQPVTPELVACLSAFLLLVHPTMTETINYISSTSTLQCSVLYLAAFWAFLKAIEGDGAAYLAYSGLMAVFLAASLLTKQESVTFPVMLAFYLLIFRKKDERWDAWAERNAFPVILASMTIAAYLVIYSQFEAEMMAVYGNMTNRYHYFLAQTRAWIRYLAWIFIPGGYSIEHIGFGMNEHIYEPMVLGAIALNAALVTATVRWCFPPKDRQAYPILSFGATWFYLAMAPTSSFYGLAEPINEHRFHLSYTIFFVALGYAAFYALTRLDALQVEWIYGAKTRVISAVTPRNWARVVTAGYLVLAAALSGWTIVENLKWRTNFALWLDTVAKDPTSVKARNNLGIEYMQQGRIEKALREFEVCAELAPSYWTCPLNAYLIYRSQGKIDLARRTVKKAAEANPTYGPGHHHLGAFYLEVDHKPEAALAEARACDEAGHGKIMSCFILMGAAYAAMGRLENSLVSFRHALEIEPNSGEAIFNTGRTLAMLGRLQEAEAAFIRLQQVEPGNPSALLGLGDVALRRKDYLTARQRLEEFTRNNQDVPDGWRLLKEAAVKLNDISYIEICDRQLARLEKKK